MFEVGDKVKCIQAPGERWCEICQKHHVINSNNIYTVSVLGVTSAGNRTISVKEHFGQEGFSFFAWQFNLLEEAESIPIRLQFNVRILDI